MTQRRRFRTRASATTSRQVSPLKTHTSTHLPPREMGRWIWSIEAKWVAAKTNIVSNLNKNNTQEPNNSNWLVADLAPELTRRSRVTLRKSMKRILVISCNINPRTTWINSGKKQWKISPWTLKIKIIVMANRLCVKLPISTGLRQSKRSQTANTTTAPSPQMTRSSWRIEGMARQGSRRAHSLSSTGRTTSSPIRYKNEVWGLMNWRATRNHANEAQWAQTTTDGSSKGCNRVLTGRWEIIKQTMMHRAATMRSRTKPLTETTTSTCSQAIRTTCSRSVPTWVTTKWAIWSNPPNTRWNQSRRGTTRLATCIFCWGARVRTGLTAGRKIRMSKANTLTKTRKLSSRRARSETRATRRRAGTGRMWTDRKDRRARPLETVSKSKTPCTTRP